LDKFRKITNKMKKLLTLLISVLFMGTLLGQNTTSTINGSLYIIKSSGPAIYLQGTGGIIDILNGSAHIRLTQSLNTLSLSGADLSLGGNNLSIMGSIGAPNARAAKLWATDAEFSDMPTVAGIPLSTSFATSAQLAGITATSLGLGNVTNVSQATMFTSPHFTGTYAYINTDTLATQLYTRSHGGGGGGGAWGSITGNIATQSDLQTALSGKLATNGSAASLTNFPTLNQSTTGSAAKWTTARSLWGNSVDGSGNITSIIAATYGGTGSAFVQFGGASSTIKTYTLPNASANILTDNASVTVAQGGTGRATATTAYGLIAAGTTAAGIQQTLTTGTSGQLLVSGGPSALPAWTTPTYPTTSGTTRKVLISDGTNVVYSTETYAAPGAQYNMPVSDGTNWVSTVPTSVASLSGFPIPQMSTSAINAISTPAEGLLVYDITLHVMKFFNGSVWKTITTN
jgi:hypothetical protein